MTARKTAKRGFGQIRTLPSKRVQAFYTGPDGALHYAESTFETNLDAEGWLTDERRIIAANTWVPPKLRRTMAEANKPMTFGAYSTAWIRDRDLKPRTREHYQQLLNNQLAPWDLLSIKDIHPELVRGWYASLDPKHPTTRAHAYGLLRGILSTATSDGLLEVNPCHIRGAGASKRVSRTKILSLDELADLVNAMPERYKCMTLLAAWTALRFGELIELRRKDIDLKAGVIHVRRGAVRAGGKVIIGTPKSQEGIRDVNIPPHIVPMLKAHLAKDISGGKEGLLFPARSGGTLASSSLQRVFYPARAKAGRPDLRWHDLRHTAGTMAAMTGATLAELMARLGHATPTAALRYQHAAEGRDAQIAKALSAMVNEARRPL